MLTLFSNIFKKLFLIFILILIFLVFVFSYIFALVYIKPRDINFAVNFIEQSLQDEFQNKNIKVGDSVLSLDKNKYTFLINLNNIEINFENSFQFYAPKLLIEFSYKDLFLKKLKINNIIASNSSIIFAKKINLNHIIKNNNNKNHLAINLPKNINISDSSLRINDIDYFLKDFTVKSSKSSLNYIKNLNVNILHHNNNFNVNLFCDVKKLNKPFLCKGNFSNLHQNYIQMFEYKYFDFIKNAKFILNGEFDLETFHHTILNLYFKGNTQVEYNILDQNIFSLKKIDGTLKYDSEKSEINISNLNLNLKNQNHLKVNLDYQFQNRSLGLNAYLKKLEKTSLILLLEKYSNQKIKKLIKEKTNNFTVSDINFTTSLNFKKPIKTQLKSSKLQLSFADIDFKFSNKFAPAKKLKGLVSIEDNIINFDLKSGFLDKIYFENATAKINKVFNRIPKFLEINLLTTSNVTHIAEYLLKNNLGKFSLSGNTENKIWIKIPIKPKPRLHEIRFKVDSYVSGLTFKNLVKDSELDVVLRKNSSNSDIVNAYFQCKECYADIPIINYDDSIIKEEAFTAQILLKPKIAKINNFKNKNKDIINIDLNLNFYNKKLNFLEITDAKFGLSDFTLKIDKTKKIHNLYFDSNQTDINLTKLTKFLLKKNPQNLYEFDVNIKKLLLKNENFGQNLNITSLYNDPYYFNFLNMKFSDNAGNLLIKQKINLKDTYKIDLEVNNIGYLVKKLSISNKIDNGFLSAHIDKKPDLSFQGEFFVSDLKVKRNNLFKKIYKTSLLKDPDQEDNFTNFTKGYGTLKLQNKILNIKDFSTHGSSLGITSNGNINFENSKYKFDGVIIPAYSLNKLLGISNIPLVGEIITGGKDEGLISVNYNLEGSLNKKAKIKINPFSTLTPSFLRKIFKLAN